MAKYATVSDVEAGFRDLTTDEESICNALLEEAAVIIDAYNTNATDDAKRVVSCRMVRRAIGDGESAQALPIGATQGSIAAGGYSQSWTISGGSTGELYIGRIEKRLLGVGNSIGSYSPLEEKVVSFND